MLVFVLDPYIQSFFFSDSFRIFWLLWAVDDKIPWFLNLATHGLFAHAVFHKVISPCPCLWRTEPFEEPFSFPTMILFPVTNEPLYHCSVPIRCLSIPQLSESCCLCPILFDMCYWCKIQNKLTFTKINEADKKNIKYRIIFTYFI